jgi:transcription-repair coupling factor (superfamily II helicase)
MDSASAFRAILRLADFGKIAKAVLRREPVSVAGLGGSAKALFIAASWQAFRRPLVVVTPETVRAESLAGDIAYFHRTLNARSFDQVSAFPAWDVDPYSGLSPHADVQQARALTLWKIRSGSADIVVTSSRALASRLPPPEAFDTFSLKLAVHDDVSEELMLEHLVTAGYLASEPVTSVGEFSRRGGIVDVYSPLMANPARIEFFGDSIESIRQFDPDEQRSTNPLERIEILPMQEQLVGREALRDWSGMARRRWDDNRYRDSLSEKLILGSDGYRTISTTRSSSSTSRRSSGKSSPAITRAWSIDTSRPTAPDTSGCIRIPSSGTWTRPGG